MEKVDYTGNKFGLLTILKEGGGLYEGTRKRRSVICRCDCGSEKEVMLRVLTKGSIKSCGCLLASQKISIKEGDKYGYWTIIKEVEPYKDSKGNTSRKMLVECICKEQKEIILNSLRIGSSQSCGCMIDYSHLKGERTTTESYIQPLDLEKINNRNFGHWKIVEEISAKRNENRKIKRTVKAQCKCGYIKETSLDKMSKSKQCSKCAMEEVRAKQTNEERGLKKKLRGVFGNMKSRCYNKNDKSYSIYGAKGITISDEWINNFKAFYEWSISNGYNQGLEIDRIDNNSGYSSDNCRYITKEENTLRIYGLTLEDVKYIRTSDFNFDRDVKNFNCSTNIIKNILEYKTFKNL